MSWMQNQNFGLSYDFLYIDFALFMTLDQYFDRSHFMCVQ